MSRNMSWLRSAGAPLSHGTKQVLCGGLPALAWRAPGSSARVRAANDQTAHPSSLASRTLSTQRATNNGEQGSRFARSSAPLAETPAAPAPEAAAPPEPVAPARPVARPVARPQPDSRDTPPPRKPVDVNSKEYKQFAGRWTRLVVGLPFLIVSSYLLYERREFFKPPAVSTGP